MVFKMTHVILLIITFLFIGESLAVQCVDHENKPVDWYYMYKLPQIKHEPKLIKGGLAYIYITSNNFKEWTLSNISILNDNSMLGLTLEPLLSSKPNVFHILYNDEPPTQKPKPKKGHTKGVVLGNENGGIWVVHSVPHLPNISERYYPLTGIVYGQSVLCVSLNVTNLNKVGIQLQYNEPQIYSQNVPESVRTIMPDLYNAAMGNTIDQSPWHNILNLTTLNGTTFVSFAKSRQFGKELYADLIAPLLNTNLFVESWLNGRDKLPSSCGYLFKVQNIQTINLSMIYINFNSSTDHSKWAVSDEKNDWICVGDINRELHQKMRGGGTLCLNSEEISKSYRSFIQKYESCKK